MTVFVDASVLVAIIAGELDGPSLQTRLDAEDVKLTSGIAQWEAAVIVGKRAFASATAGLSEVERYCARLDIRVVAVEEREAIAAIEAWHRYGKGSGSRARLNMGDCFAYACARTNEARLLYKGNDFSHTDLA